MSTNSQRRRRLALRLVIGGAIGLLVGHFSSGWLLALLIVGGSFYSGKTYAEVGWGHSMADGWLELMRRVHSRHQADGPVDPNFAIDVRDVTAVFGADLKPVGVTTVYKRMFNGPPVPDLGEQET